MIPKDGFPYQRSIGLLLDQSQPQADAVVVSLAGQKSKSTGAKPTVKKEKVQHDNNGFDMDMGEDKQATPGAGFVRY